MATSPRKPLAGLKRNNLEVVEGRILTETDLTKRINRGLKVFEISGPDQFYANSTTPFIVARLDDGIGPN